jgi:hypothetical protein
LELYRWFTKITARAIWSAKVTVSNAAEVAAQKAIRRMTLST